MSTFDIDLRVERGGLDLRWKLGSQGCWHGLYGASGHGKTTALELALGWLPPGKGHARVGEGRPTVGYAPQDLLLFPHWSVQANLHAASLVKRTAPRGPDLFDEVVSALELAPLLDRRAADLSGGEGRRVALGRALLSVSPGGLLVLDEPLSSLDRPRRQRALDLLLEFKDRVECAAFVVSHSATDLQVLCDQVQVLEEREGRAGNQMQFCDPSPSSILACESDGFENIVTGYVEQVSGDSACIQLDDPQGGGPCAVTMTAPGKDLVARERVVLGLRGDDVLVSLESPGQISARNVYRGVVEQVRPLSTYRTLGVRVGGRTGLVFFTHVTSGALEELRLEVDSEVFLVFKTRSVTLLARSGAAH